MKKNILVFVLAGVLFLVFGGLSKPASAQYIKDDTWKPVQMSGGMGFKAGIPIYMFNDIKIDYPSDLATDSAGNIYVADVRKDRILKLNPSGTLIKSWGEAGEGNTQFNSPFGIAVDSINVYVADRDNHRIKIFGLNGNFITSFGTKREWGGDGIGEKQLWYPADVAVDSIGNVYVVMSSVLESSEPKKQFYCVKKFSPPSYNEVMALDCEERDLISPAETEFVDGEFAGAAPTTIAVDVDGVIYVGAGNYVMIFRPDGSYVDQFGGITTFPGQNGRFNGVKGLYVSGKKIFVTDYYGDRFQRCILMSTGLAAGYICESYGAGIVDGPFGIAVDPSGNVFLATHVKDSVGADSGDVVKFKLIQFKAPPLRGYIRGG